MVASGSDVQIDKGSFTRIHNAILEKLVQYDFTSREYACLLYLLRMTYGFNRKEVKLSNGDIGKATGFDPANVSRAMRSLTINKVVIRSETGPNTAPTWKFNKYFEQWTVTSRVKTTIEDSANYCQNDNSLEGDSCQNDNTTIAEMTIEVLPKQQDHYCQNDNSYISAKDNKDNKDNSSSSAAVHELWRQNVRGTLTTIIVDDLNDLIDTYGADTVMDAITEAVRCNGRSVKYVARILESWASGKSNRPESKSVVAAAPPATTANGKVNGFDVSQLY